MYKLKDLPFRIKSCNSDRLPLFLKMKYEAMYQDRYRFFRATTNQFFEDIPADSFLHSGPAAWLCGDLHLENYGSYKGDNRLAYFNMNDFDECILGPCSFDVVRMLCSIYVASENLKVSLSDAHMLAKLFADAYFSKLGEGYIRVLEKESASGIMKTFLEEVATRKRRKFLDKKTILKKGMRKLKIDNMHFVEMPGKDKEDLKLAFSAWFSRFRDARFYKVRDIATRIAGTSSLGLRRYALLVEGNGSPDENYLLELKETRRSCAEKFVRIKQPDWPSEASRIIEIQKRVLSDPPALLNSFNYNGRNFVMKELQPLADRIDYSLFKGNLKKLGQMLENMAAIYAWSNLRSSGRQNSAIADDLIKFAKTGKKYQIELLQHANAYSKTINKYHSVFCQAYDKGYFK
jgi:uncharacterized protein (DUF2252 family)